MNCCIERNRPRLKELIRAILKHIGGFNPWLERLIGVTFLARRKRQFTKSCLQASRLIWKQISTFEIINQRQLLLPMDSIQLITRPISDELWFTNPTILDKKGAVHLFARATNRVYSPESDKYGAMKREERGSSLLNGVLTGLLDNRGDLSGKEFVIPVTTPPCFEDPRVITYKDSYILVGTVIEKESDLVNREWKLVTGIYLAAQDRLLKIPSPKGRPLEKNWVPISVDGDSLLLQYMNNPLSIIEIDLISGESNLKIIDEDVKVTSLNGGTQWVDTGQGTYLRVARKRFPMQKLGYIHLSYLVLHGQNFKEIKRSRPFIFRKIGFEICNGLLLDEDGVLHFSWGEDDKKMFYGKKSLSTTLDWLDENSSHLDSKISHFNKGVFDEIFYSC